MSTATKDHQKPHATGHAEVPQAHDPEHDIDARSATKWFIGGSIALFLTLWILLPIFVRVQEEERKTKVDDRPTLELHEVRDAQREFLNGANPRKKTIDQAIREALPK